MEIVDANVILRYLLKDHQSFYGKSREIIDNREITIPFEVIAEVVYVLEKVYKVPRKKITEALTVLHNYSNIHSFNKDVVFKGLEIYEIEKIDFVDALLVGYNQIQSYQIHTFDKKLKKLCTSLQ